MKCPFSMLVVSLFSLNLFSAANIELANSSFDLNNGQRIVAIGDIHGDLQALKTILRAQLIIDRTGDWIANEDYLVLVGDLVDRGPESKEVMDFVMNLESSAKAKGGNVHALLGNHEYLVTMGSLKYIHENDITAFGKGRGKHKFDPLISAFQGESIYAEWFRTRRTMIKIGDTLFVHGGLDNWVFDYSMNQVNELLHQWLLYFQEMGPMPDVGTRFLFGGEGPLWNRRFAVDSEDAHHPNNVSSFLDHYGVRRVVVGHTIVPNISISLAHPFYGDQVLMIDSAISIAYRGILTAIEIDNEGVSQYRFNRGNGEREQTARVENFVPSAISCVKALSSHLQ